MSSTTGIEWTEATWNPLAGCSFASPGCTNCYAAGLAAGRLRSTPTYQGLAVRPEGHPAEFTGEIRLFPERLDQPLRWRAPRRIFVNSMSDLFHHDVPTGFISRVFETMARAPQHTFQVLTKRPQRMARWVRAHQPDPLPNVWLGTSIESKQYAWRADHLRKTPAALRWLSIEPLIDAPGYLNLDGIGWVVVGGESGPGARAMHPVWPRMLRDRCVGAGIPFFFKQWGEWAPRPDGMVEVVRRVGRRAAGRELDGRTWDEYPT